MTLKDSTREKIENIVKQNHVVLFMKGTPKSPMCGFSSKTVGLLDSLLDEYESVDVLEDEEIREGIKIYGDWPTIPQLYIDGELMGGCDIVTGMFNSGELHEMLGVEAPDRTPPEVTITDAAAEKITEAMQGHEGIGLHFSIDAGFQSQFNVAPAEGHEIKVETNGITMLFDVASAQRANGAVIDWVETMQGAGLTIHLPQAPEPVKQMSVAQLKDHLDSDSVILIDVRGSEERALAQLDEARAIDAETMQEIEAMPKDTPLAFLCHNGNRSQVAAEHFRKMGFTNVSNVAGGINAWSKEIDPSVPEYGGYE
ncbi:MAG: Grx4 family monothiol glutaredoxin [Xanthomonadales bacterium]|nr:Grx4 family monothiol glutaredoxin [Gammaproteobacteria bacterium]MBT8073113.1 Grx4 family monothiol glutaredoxin [Gammaproteobacteria bacterium]NNK03956.1 Grx4 family monothiol glutaredoxin [Xanthomonadales bacterium]